MDIAVVTISITAMRNFLDIMLLRNYLYTRHTLMEVTRIKVTIIKVTFMKVAVIKVTPEVVTLIK